MFGGYLYFHKAPHAEEFHSELIRKLERLHMYDCLRTDKTMMGNSVELRVPFLDKSFIEYVMSVDANDKMITNERPMEKYILRKAFDKSECGEDYLPSEILWRQKE